MIPASVPGAFHSALAHAERLAAQKEWSAAIALYQQVLARVPNEPYTLVQMSYLHSLQGSYRAAEQFALDAARAGTSDPQILAELLPRLRTFNRVPEMLGCLERVPMSQMPIPLLITVAAQLSYVNLPDRAIAYLDEARAADPDYPTTLLARAQVLTYLGRFVDAQADIKRSMRRAPEIAQGYWLQAWLQKQSPTQNHVDAIQRELRRPGRNANDVALLEFALHKELDDLGRYEEAWAALSRGCAAKRSKLSYDRTQTEELMTALANFEWQQQPDANERATQPVPIFIVGMHRSGTTLLEQLLDGHANVSAIGELYDFTSAMRHVTDHHCRGVVDTRIVQRAASASLQAAGERYLSSVAWRIGGKGFFTDKLPSNFLNIGFIAHALPHAKILHMSRDPVETCFSNLRELFSEANAYSYDMDELAHYYRCYERLMSHWRGKFPNRILDVNYKELISRPEEQLRRVTDFCGLTFHADMLNVGARNRAVVTASAVQVRTNIQVRDTPKWAPYAEWLRPLINKLAA